MKRVWLIWALLSCSCFASVISQWKMNDNATNSTVVDSINVHSGVFAGTGGGDDFTSAHTDVGKINSSILFDGTNDSVTITDHADFSFENGASDSPFSISAWVFVAATASNQVILSKAVSVSNGEWIFQVTDAEKAYFSCIDTDDDFINIQTNIMSAGWNHIVATYSGSEANTGMDIYLNGISNVDARSGSGVYGGMTAGAKDVLIGARSGAPPHTFADKIDNIVIYNKKLTALEVRNLYNGGRGTEDVGRTIDRRRYSVNQFGNRNRNRYSF